MNFHTLQAQLEAEGIRLVVKRGWFWSALHWIVLVATFGGNRHFRSRYITTLASVIAVPERWEWEPLGAGHIATIKHEKTHVRQFRWFGLGNAWLGLVPMGIIYLLLPLPIGLAWGRWVLEREAYLVGFRELLAAGRRREGLIARGTRELTSGRYGWTLHPWIFRSHVRRYFEKRL